MGQQQQNRWPVWVQLTWRQARRLVVLVIGGTVLLIGVALLVLPGPAFVVIPAGIAILATEFVWARNLLKRVKQQAEQVIDRGRNWRRGTSRESAPPEEQGERRQPG